MFHSLTHHKQLGRKLIDLSSALSSAAHKSSQLELECMRGIMSRSCDASDARYMYCFLGALWGEWGSCGESGDGGGGGELCQIIVSVIITSITHYSDN